MILTIVHLSKLLNADSTRLWQLNLGDYITIHLTEVHVVKLGDVWNLGCFTAGDACGVFAANSHISELHCQSFEDDHSFGEDVFFGEAEYYLSDLHGLNLADETWDHTKHAAIRAVGHRLGRRRQWEKAPIARSSYEVVHGYLAIPL